MLFSVVQHQLDSAISLGLFPWAQVRQRVACGEIYWPPLKFLSLLPDETSLGCLEAQRSGLSTAAQVLSETTEASQHRLP